MPAWLAPILSSVLPPIFKLIYDAIGADAAKEAIDQCHGKCADEYAAARAVADAAEDARFGPKP